MSHPSVTPVATVHVVCPHHEDELIVDHALMADGSKVVMNLRGRSDERARIPSADGDHLARYHYRCPKPACSYDAQMTWDRIWPFDDLLDGMKAQGTPEMTITDIDQTKWRVVRK